MDLDVAVPAKANGDSRVVDMPNVETAPEESPPESVSVPDKQDVTLTPNPEVAELSGSQLDTETLKKKRRQKWILFK